MSSDDQIREPLILDGGQDDVSRLELRNHGEAFPRVQMRSDGTIVTGDGTKAPDDPLLSEAAAHDVEVFEDVVVLNGDPGASGEVVFSKPRSTVMVEFNLTDVVGPDVYTLVTPIEVGPSATITVTGTGPTGSFHGVPTPFGPGEFTTLGDMNPWGYWETGLLGVVYLALLSATGDDPNTAWSLDLGLIEDVGGRRAYIAAMPGVQCTIAGLDVIGLPASVTLDGDDPELFKAEGSVIPETVAPGPQVGNILVEYVPGATPEIVWGDFGLEPAVPVISYRDLGLVTVGATPHAVISPDDQRGLIAFSVPGGACGVVRVLSNVNLLTGTVTVRASN